MKTEKKSLSWEPIRNGDFYCAPACGSKCTWEAYLNAKMQADILAKRLGPNFQPYVHENMGWWWSAHTHGEEYLDTVRVHPFYGQKTQEGSYTAMFKQWTVSDEDPRVAVGALVEKVNEVLETITRELDRAVRSLHESI